MSLVVDGFLDSLGENKVLLLLVGEAMLVAHLHEDVAEGLLLECNAELLERLLVFVQLLIL